MTSDELKALQERQGWSNREAARVLNEALGSRYHPDTVTKWRSGRSPVPKRVAAFLGALEGGAPPATDEQDDRTGIPEVDELFDRAAAEDAPPDGSRLGGEPGRPPSLTLIAGGPGAYSKICEEFFELIATGVGMIGAAVGSENMRRDSLIILEDKGELGKAWGRLAEQNETFARILTATDKQGAYLAVALATGTTAGRIWRNHQPPLVPAVGEPPHVEASNDGDQREPAAAPPTL